MSSKPGRVNFPKRKLPRIKIAQFLNQVESETPSWTYSSKGFRLGYPQTCPLDAATVGIERFVKWNSNNVGMPSAQSHGTKRAEWQVVNQMSSLLHGEKLPGTSGYICSGSTEGNIYAMWIARNRAPNEICLLKTKLSHYSITKGTDLLGITSVIDIPLSPEYGMDPFAFKQTILSELKKGKRDFLLILTAGYTITGTLDPIAEIASVIRKLKREHNFSIYIHVDAAFGGFVLPFVKDAPLFDFRIPEVSSIAVDFHKMGGVPIPGGIFLCRKNLQKSIERKSGYSKSLDDTLLGSRPGWISVSCWNAINQMGQAGYEKQLRRCMQVKKYFLNKIKPYAKKIIHSPHMNVVAIAFDTKLSKKMVDFYRLYPSEDTWDNKLGLYKFYFMPHVTKGAINHFFDALKKETG